MSGIPEDLQSLKVIELKELSAAFNLPKSGNKKDLIQRLQVLTLWVKFVFYFEFFSNQILTVLGSESSFGCSVCSTER